MKVASIISSVLLGASVATACGGIATISNPLGAGDAGPSSEPPQQGSLSSGSSSGGAPGAARADAGMPAFNVSCQGTQSCPPSQVCCATLSFGTGTGGVDVACANRARAAPTRFRDQRRVHDERRRLHAVTAGNRELLRGRGNRRGARQARRRRPRGLGGVKPSRPGDSLRFDGSSQLALGSCPPDGGVGCEAGEEPLREVG